MTHMHDNQLYGRGVAGIMADDRARTAKTLADCAAVSRAATARASANSASSYTPVFTPSSSYAPSSSSTSSSSGGGFAVFVVTVIVLLAGVGFIHDFITSPSAEEVKRYRPASIAMLSNGGFRVEKNAADPQKACSYGMLRGCSVVAKLEAGRKTCVVYSRKATGGGKFKFVANRYDVKPDKIAQKSICDGERGNFLSYCLNSQNMACNF